MFKILLTFFIAFNALARERVVTTLHSHQMGGTIYYNCQSVEQRAGEILKTLGALNVLVHCTGGLGHGWSGPAVVEASFEVPAIVENEEDSLHLGPNGFDRSCYMNTALIGDYLPRFENIEVLREYDYCVNNDSPWAYELEVTR